MVFLPGDHTLDTNITVTNVARLTMHGESYSGNIATVVCSESVGLSFTSMVDLKIDSLAFTSCSRKYAISIPDILQPTVNVALHLQSTQYSELVNCSFHDNNLGTALMVNNTSITLAGNSEFTHNHCESDSCVVGAIAAFSSSLTFTGNTTFIENNASSLTQVAYGGAIYASYTVLTFNGISTFMRNSADNGGGAIYAIHNTVLSFNGINNFINNSADYGAGGAIYTSNSTVLISFNGTSKFINNSAQSGGAICAITNSSLTLNGTIHFTNNGGGIDTENGDTVGGGVYMGLKTTFSIIPNTTMFWENNHATYGGAIYVVKSNPFVYCQAEMCTAKEDCFFQLPSQNLSNGIDVQLIFKNNSADTAGSVLYGGAIDHCKLTHGLDSYSSGEVFDMVFHIDNDTDYDTTSSISSDPLRICLCKNDHPDCSETWYHFPRTVYPGEIFQVSVVAVGQRNGTVPSRVISTIDNIQYRGSLRDSQNLQQANSTCTKLNYTMLSLSQFVEIDFYAESSPCVTFGGVYKLSISVYIHQSCPPGFNISQSEKSCVCEPKLAKYCSITNGVGQITRNSSQHFWVGYDNQTDGLILHPQCPFDYCVSHPVVFPLNNTDQQCAYNRSGLLCGACKEGFILVLGSSQCRKCTNSHLALLIPFAVMGVALVFLLLVCKLTVATGTLSGLVFYANIVGVNRTIFLPVESTDGFSVFIAWLNLDFGIETCFLDGMDAYTNTWLQFVFPVYIWVLVGLMIIVSHFSRTFAKLLGNNPVSVLATLVLLSYQKILRTLIAVFYITYLEYPTYNRSVWLYDANVDYLSGKHIPLFLVAILVFLFLFLPYTLFLLFGQWLQAISHLKLFSWVNSARLKPFMDSYHAPYKAKHRYWPGLLLVLRCVLLLVFALKIQQDPNINLLAILVGTGILVVWAWVNGGVYRNWCLDALEGSFALNLIIIAASTMYVSHSGGNQDAVWCTSVLIAFITFITILAYHIFQQLKHTKMWKKAPKLNLKFNRPNTMQVVNDPFSRFRESLLEEMPRPNYGSV